MKVLLQIPDDILSLIETSNGKISRNELAKSANISEMEARIWLGVWKRKLGDTAPKSLGLQTILQDRNNRLATQVKDLQKLIATEQILIDQIRDMIPAFKIVNNIPDVKPKSGKLEERDVIVIWSDFHADEVVQLDQMEGRNEYNRNILLGRLWNLVRGIIYIVNSQRNSFDIGVLNLDILGDMVSGNIHKELRETNDAPLLQTVLMLAHVLSQAIIALIPYFTKIRITCLPGNHGRTTKKPEFKNRVINNYDTLVYQITSMFLSEYIKEGVIEFNIPQSSECIVVRKGWAFLLGHSDQIKGWSGFPVYGFYRDGANQQKLRKLRSVLSKNDFVASETLEGAIINMKSARSVSGYDYREAGHWHSMQILDDWTTIINGALIGGNEYSVNKLHAISEPTQTIAYLSEQWGLKGVEPIHCIDKGHNFQVFNKGVLGEMADFMINMDVEEDVD